MDAMKIANSIPMWLACALPVAFVILQAVLFARGAYKSGKKLGLNDKQMKKAMKTWNIRCRGTAWNGYINTRSFRNGSLDHDPLLYRMGVIRNILCK